MTALKAVFSRRSAQPSRSIQDLTRLAQNTDPDTCHRLTGLRPDEIFTDLPRAAGLI